MSCEELRDLAPEIALGTVDGEDRAEALRHLVLVTVDPSHQDRVSSGELVTKDKRTIPIASLELDRNGSWGGAIPTRFYDVAAIRLLGESPGEVLEAPIGQRAAPAR